MIFQIIDDKVNCPAIFYDGIIEFEPNLSKLNLTKTWKYELLLEEFYKEVNFAYLYSQKSLFESCPENSKEEWNNVVKRLNAFYKSFKEARIKLNDVCFFELVPEKFLKEYCSVKNDIVEYVLEHHSRPENYQFLLELSKLIEEIKNKSLKINRTNIKLNNSKNIHYNIFGTKTGRLVNNGGFPILTLKKELRSIIEPHNDFFIEFDFNAFEARVMLSLSDNDQPLEDIHEWNLKNCFKNVTNRDQAKINFFSWLYDEEKRNSILEKYYNKNYVINKYWNKEKKIIFNIFKRRIEHVDFHHALSYIIQSTSNDLFLRQVLKVNEFLRINNLKSRIAFIIHDSLVIDYRQDEIKYLKKIIHIFKQTQFGEYNINIKKGFNYGEMNGL